MISESHKYFEVSYLDEHNCWVNVWPRHASFMAAKGTAHRVKKGLFFDSHRGPAYDRLITLGKPPLLPKQVRIVDRRDGQTKWLLTVPDEE